MSVDFRTPIACPYCHKKLTTVQVQVTTILEWTRNEKDSDVKGEFEDNGQGSTEVYCYECMKKIGHYDANTKWGLFPEAT